MAIRGQTPFSHRSGKGLLYAMPAGLKLVLLPLLSASVFVPNPAYLPLFVPLIIILACASGIRPWTLLEGSKALFVFAFVMLLVKGVTFPPPGLDRAGLVQGLFLGARMVLSFALAALLFLTTTMGQIYGALSWVENALGLRRARVSLGIALMLMFIPAFFEAWNNAELAWRGRGGRGRVKTVFALVPLVLERLMERAAAVAEAIEARGF